MLRPFILFFFLPLDIFAQARQEYRDENSPYQTFIGVLADTTCNEPVFVDDKLVFFLHPHERFVCDTIITEHPTRALVTLADGHCGFIQSYKIIPDKDQSLFKITYAASLFQFSRDTSVYAYTISVGCGWGAINWWEGMDLVYAGDSDLYTIANRTQHAFQKDTFAMLELLNGSFGDVWAPWQYDFQKWKVINSWSDDELSGFVLEMWNDYFIQSPWETLLLRIDTPFTDSALCAYYQRFYPKTWLIIQQENKEPLLTSRDYKKLRRKLAHFHAPAEKRKPE